MMKKETKKILLCIDKFKDTLSAQTGAQIIEQTLLFKAQALKKQIEVKKMPISDGGEGFLQCMQMAMKNTKLIQFPVCGPLPEIEQHEASILIDAEHQTAFLEVANLAGLGLVPIQQRNALRASSRAIGLVIRRCYDEYKIKKFVIGSGGSAFSDAGWGAIQALNCFEFFDSQGIKISEVSFEQVLEVSYARVKDQDFLDSIQIIMPCDVQNPMLGERGSARVYAPQKGATSEQIPQIDLMIGHAVKLYTSALHQDSEQIFQKIAQLPGSGASGALVGAFLALLSQSQKAEVISGMDFVAAFLNLEQLIEACDLVITGEGSFDDQTLEGKAVFQIIKLCEKYKKPVVVICGINKVQIDLGCAVIDFRSRFGIEMSMTQTGECLKHVCENELFDLINQN